MFAAALTTILFSFSVIFGARATRVLGPRWANLGRMTLATLLLAIWAHGFGSGFAGPGFAWFFLSGVIGFGLGDMALFGALPRIGPRLAILLTQCLAAPFGGLAEWVWLGTTLRVQEILWAGVILSGVAFALAPDHGSTVAPRVFWIGVLCGVGSALGQALGAVVSRKANAVNALADLTLDGGTAAYQRAVGGLLLTSLFAALWWVSARRAKTPDPAPRWREGWPLTVVNALAGPTIGVACYQWALRGNPSGVVLPIIATSPIVTMLFAWWLDGTRPTRRALVGSFVAVLGVVGLGIS
ncbi:MAG TPA: DMT family transporter [Chthoniobacteraceae bacterium]|jgi:drug/metabolite transporter (DMT)-like permease